MKDKGAELIKALKEEYVNEQEESVKRKLFYEIYDLEHAREHTWVRDVRGKKIDK